MVSTPNEQLKIRFAGRLIDLLGQQMYGGAVASVAELVANAWDADAAKVEISIPEDVSAPGAELIVRDYGRGMTFRELNDYYLHIGYERRARGETTEGGRFVMGRKGIGKLAGFGIADDIVVTSIKEGRLVEFTLNHDKLRSIDSAAESILVKDRDEATDLPSGVIVTFKGLKLARNINIENFRASMARRFALGADQMTILINDIPISKELLDIEYRYPESEKGEWTEEDIPGFGKVKYWFGFLKSTISEPELRGISVFARDRVAQFTPFVFNLSGGINGQVALEYLTGQVKADQLDDSVDYIATDRQTVNWQFDKAPIFEEWGQNKIKELCADWKRKHTQRNVDRFQHRLGDLALRIDGFSSVTEKKDITSALQKVAGIERLTEDDFQVIANSMVAGFERESVKKVIRRINTADENSLPELTSAIKEWDIISSVATAEVVLGKIEIINQFQKHIKDRIPEKSGKGRPEMQNFVKSYPWLLGHDYEQLKPADIEHEHGMDKWIDEVLNETNTEFRREDPKDPRRFDLLVMTNEYEIMILELMRPGVPADYDHVSRLIRYVTRIEDAIESGSTERYRKKSVHGLLIADEFAKDGSLNRIISNNRTLIDAVTWDELWKRVRGRYEEFFQMLKMKAPNDPRMRLD